MWTLLDDMQSGKSVSGVAKAYARVAYEPFKRPDDTFDGWMTLEEAEHVIHCCDRGIPA